MLKPIITLPISDPPFTSWHHLSLSSAHRELDSDTTRGLTQFEASCRLSRYGSNTLPDASLRPLWLVFLRQFASPLIYILLAAAVLAFSLGKRGDAMVIIIVVLVNSIIGAIQEGRAEHSMASLRKISLSQVRVLRDGKEQLIAASSLVPGDIMLLAAGDAVAGDARLLEVAALEAAEGAVTGESIPVEKHIQTLPFDTLLSDRANMVFSGTHITSGRAKALVVATGFRTEVGKIVHMTMGAAESKTPLEVRINQFGRLLVMGSGLMGVLVIGAGILRGLPIVDVLLVTISLMVSLVPEGLPVALTIALAVGMQRMASKGTIVRRLAAVETLGCTNVICSDKTGTLTKNEMTVTTFWLADGRTVEVSGTGYSPQGTLSCNGCELHPANDSALRLILEGGVLCNDSQLVQPNSEERRWMSLGDPTESALLTVALKGCIEPAPLRKAWERRGEIPFNSGTKLMATQHFHTQKLNRVFLKGAPEMLLPLCGHIRHADQVVPFETEARQKALKTAEEMAAQALRILAVAMIDDAEIDQGAGFDQFKGRSIFLGLIGQIDPPRVEAKVAVAECRAAGIRPIMVTGDHKATGFAIARMLGIAVNADRAVDGRELEAMSEKDLNAQIGQIAVFARVLPRQKVRIVEALQSQGHVVAMTGDGVNDAPALARADVGVAMGVTGTEAAKSAAKIIITDDNFATIVNAVEQGRLVYGNMQKLLLFLFATSIDEILIMLGALLFGYPLPLAAVQILWINLVTEGTLTLNLVMDGPEGNEMQRVPIRTSEPLITGTMMRRMAVMVPASVAATLGYFIWRLSTGAPFPVVQTETFTLLVVCQWFNVLNCGSATRSVLSLGFHKNPWLLGGLVVANLLQLAVVFTAPMNKLFHTVPITLSHVFLIGAVASSILWTEEIRKCFARRRLRKAPLV
jgi:magnesium-transporting ATPase (P-type)